MSLLSIRVCVVFAGLFIFRTNATTNATDCWDKIWYNNNHPTATNRSDIEPPPAKDVLENISHTLCLGGELTARCKKVNGVEYNTATNDTTFHYTTTCDVTSGFICQPWLLSALCHDFTINFGCKQCPRGAGSGVAMTGTSGSGSIGIGSGVTGSGKTGSGVTGNGITGSGVTRSGVTGNGIAGSGVTGSGATESGVTRSGVAGNANGSKGNGASSVACSLVLIFVCLCLVF